MVDTIQNVKDEKKTLCFGTTRLKFDKKKSLFFFKELKKSEIKYFYLS
jgi:hypothetical protein